MVNWDKSYRESASRLFGDQPNQYLREVLARSDVTPASALCLGDGDGRNGSWLAGMGLRVTALDLSAVATEQGRAHDQIAGVHVERIITDLADWHPNSAKHWDAAFLFYLQCEEQVRCQAITRAAAALKSGGWFVAEGFARNAREPKTLGPKIPDLLYDLEAMIGALAGFRIMEAFEGTVWLDEGERHQGPAHVVRLLAQKP